MNIKPPNKIVVHVIYNAKKPKVWYMEPIKVITVTILGRFRTNYHLECIILGRPCPGYHSKRFPTNQLLSGVTVLLLCDMQWQFPYFSVVALVVGAGGGCGRCCTYKMASTIELGIGSWLGALSSPCVDPECASVVWNCDIRHTVAVSIFSHGRVANWGRGFFGSVRRWRRACIPTNFVLLN